ncbi:hypothetical protein C0J52_14818 [Blattella germanica]|nr:hypothetical protein C0J52_14818 [Blattella germanica]
MDSGHETLFSDDSPSCDLVTTPSACSSSGLGSASSGHTLNHNHLGTEDAETSRLGPPKITPHSGVLGKGKVVIRPIAFKPVAMTPAARFSNSGERYGSTPILARPGSQLILQQRSQTPPRERLQPFPGPEAALLIHLDVFIAAPGHGVAVVASADIESETRRIRHGKSSFRLLSGGGGGCVEGGSLLDLTPSPSDSGVAELEAALRDRDSEVAYLRQTMEHNEQVIFRVYQEKERVWERELRRMKSVHENRLRAGAHKAEQMLVMQTYQIRFLSVCDTMFVRCFTGICEKLAKTFCRTQLQQDKKRLREEADRASQEVSELRQEVDLLRGRLEETEWGLCQKTGELALLKAQLKDSQGEQTTKGHELLQLRGQTRDLKAELERQESEANLLRQQMKDRDEEISTLQRLAVELEETNRANALRQREGDDEVLRLKAEVNKLREELIELNSSDSEVRKLRAEVSRMSRELKLAQVTKSGHEVEETREQVFQTKSESKETQLLMGSDVTVLRKEMERLQMELTEEKNEFEQERVTWAQEKEKVLRYQRQLQLNYVQMFRRTKTLEAEVESLTLELELETKTGRGAVTTHSGKKQLPAIEMGHTIEL